MGILAAVWYAVSLFYHWTYTEPLGNDAGPNGAKPLIFPQKFFGDLDTAPRPILARMLERPLRYLAHSPIPALLPDQMVRYGNTLPRLCLAGGVPAAVCLSVSSHRPCPARARSRVGKIVACIVALLFIAGVAFTPTRGHSKWATPVSISLS